MQDWKRVISRRAEKFCRIELEMREANVGRRLDVTHSASSDLNRFMVRIPKARDSQELAQVDREGMIVANGFEKSILMKSAEGIQLNAVFYMRDV